MRKIIISIIVFLLACCFCACSGRNTAQDAERTGGAESESEFPDIESEEEKEMASPDGKETELKEYYTRKSRIQDVAGDPVFGDYGRLIFPVNSGYRVHERKHFR